MQLNDFQQEMIDGRHGKGAQMAMNIQRAVGEGFEAERLVPVSRVHISLSAQNADIWFTEKITDAGARARVTPTVNPGYCPQYFLKKGWLKEEDAWSMRRTEAAYKKLGANMTLSCTPYVFENRPAFGEICAFSETNVTIFANAVLGARTNRESAMSAACAAVTGFVPEYGMLLQENRYGNVLVKVTARVESRHQFAGLGLCGKKIGRGIPVFAGLPEKIGMESMIALGAALNVSGSYDMFHIPGVTPEAPDLEAAFGGKAPERIVEITDRDIEAAWEQYSYAPEGRIDYVLLGCPHYTEQQVREAAVFLDGKKARVPVMILTSRRIVELMKEDGTAEILENAGADLIPDTCADEKCCFGILKGQFGATDSPKALYYMETYGIRMAVRDMETCLEWAVMGGADATAASGAEDVSLSPAEDRRRCKKVYKCRVISPGRTLAEAVCSREEILFYDSDFSTGVITEKGHDLDGQSVSGKIVAFPGGKGSSVVQADGLYNLTQNGKAPAGFIVKFLDTVLVSTAVVMKIPMVWKVEEAFWSEVQSGDMIELDADRETLTVIKQG